MCNYPRQLGDARVSGVASALSTFLALVAIFLGHASPVIGQDCENRDPDILLDFQDLGLSAVELFYLSDFDPSDTALHPVLFRFSVENLGETSVELGLRFEVRSDADQLFEGQTEPFVLAAGELRAATNQELSDASSDFQLDSYDISDAGEDLQNVILETGFLPEGRYLFRLSLIDPLRIDDPEISVCTIDVEVTNPRTIDPIFPGSTFDATLPIENSQFPQFQWESQSMRFNFRLCPVLPGDGSGEEVMENEPVYENLEFVTGFMGTHTFLYPSSAEPLMDGQEYCWQVEAIVSTSGGEVTFSSDIYCFQIETGAMTTILDETLEIILLRLPPGVLDEVLGQLEGYRSSGKVTVDGVRISKSRLGGMLRSLLSEGWEVDVVEIE